MSSIEEKRVYGATSGKTDVFVATDTGIVRVECSGGLVGGFGLIHQCRVFDITASDGRLAAATSDDVLVWCQDGFVSGGTPRYSRFTAVGFHDGLVVAGPTQIARRTGGEWTELEPNEDGSIAVSAIDGALVGTDRGVYRIGDRSLSPVGLAHVRDVSAVPIPLAGTNAGLYQLKNGWELVFDGAVHCVESDGSRVHIGTDDGLYVRTDGSFERISLPVTERIAGIGYGESTYAVTVDGTFLVESEGEWRARSIGIPDVCGLAVP